MTTSDARKKPKLTDAERYKRFLDAAKEAGASDDHKDFDKAFEKVVISSSDKAVAREGRHRNKTPPA